MKSRTNQSLDKLAAAAFKQATQKAIKKAIDTNTPLILWKDGKIAEVDPRTMRIESKQPKRKTVKKTRHQ
jgi:hypothetical protein